ncbi:MAG: hypothetical protein AMJ78_10510 [Omnitrophica WOR_2 bacterium SM23_29]|nr:MAG: hypothetical protein AMJ78_10510 [Omnitrophica WOR_2 bacterium SM23_29]
MNLSRIEKSIFAAAVLLVALIVFPVIASANTLLYYTSSPSSWVGHGETVTVSPSDGFDFFVSRNFDQGVSFRIDNLATNPDPWSHKWWLIDFAAPFDAPLQVGHHGNATRFPFQDPSVPGLAFCGNGRGDNTLTGYFDVFEAVYDTNSEVTSFAADFVQYDEGIEDWWNRGSVRYNSEIPIPEPSTILLFGFGLASLFACKTSHRGRV